MDNKKKAQTPLRKARVREKQPSLPTRNKSSSKWKNVRDNIGTIREMGGGEEEEKPIVQIEYLYGENFLDGLTFPDIGNNNHATHQRTNRRGLLDRMISQHADGIVRKEKMKEEEEKEIELTLPPIGIASESSDTSLAMIEEAEKTPSPNSETNNVESKQDTINNEGRNENEERKLRLQKQTSLMSRTMDIGHGEDDSKDRKRHMSLPNLDIENPFSLVRMNSYDQNNSDKDPLRRPTLGELLNKNKSSDGKKRSLTDGIVSRKGTFSPMPDQIPKQALQKKTFKQLENLVNLRENMSVHSSTDSAIESLSDSMLSLEVSTIGEEQFRCEDFVEDNIQRLSEYDPKVNEVTRLSTPGTNVNLHTKKANRALSRIAEDAVDTLDIPRTSLDSADIDGMSQSKSVLGYYGAMPKMTFEDLKKAAKSKIERLNYLKSFETRTIRSQLSQHHPGNGEEPVVEWKQGKVIDRGAFGTVFQGLTNGAQLIAVKEVYFNQNKDVDIQKQRLENEIEILKGLSHPNIVKFQGTCALDDKVQIFMNFVAGGTLSSLMDNFGPLSESVHKRFTQQMMSAVAYIHSKGVVHRDIKGANILIEPRGTIKLIDFGCSREMSLSRNGDGKDSSLMKSLRGTPFWMAPEVIRGTGCNHKSDIWSVGCTVIEMATGRPPWSDVYDNTTAVMFAIGSGNVPDPILPDDTSKEARDFVKECITRKMEDRPSADMLLVHPFVSLNSFMDI